MWHIIQATDLAKRDHIERPVRALELYYRGQTHVHILVYVHGGLDFIDEQFYSICFAFVWKFSNQIRYL
jgi:hypothetical protein